MRACFACTLLDAVLKKGNHLLKLQSTAPSASVDMHLSRQFILLARFCPSSFTQPENSKIDIV
jgi:hypothetical protein